MDKLQQIKLPIDKEFEEFRRLFDSSLQSSNSLLSEVLSYIKQRNGTFDSRINNVLAQLLPEEHNQVWSNYLSAATDRTFTAEGRRVRIVAATGGGHSQIVIYN